VPCTNCGEYQCDCPACRDNDNKERRTILTTRRIGSIEDVCSTCLNNVLAQLNAFIAWQEGLPSNNRIPGGQLDNLRDTGTGIRDLLSRYINDRNYSNHNALMSKVDGMGNSPNCALASFISAPNPIPIPMSTFIATGHIEVITLSARDEAEAAILAAIGSLPVSGSSCEYTNELYVLLNLLEVYAHDAERTAQFMERVREILRRLTMAPPFEPELIEPEPIEPEPIEPEPIEPEPIEPEPIEPEPIEPEPIEPEPIEPEPIEPEPIEPEPIEPEPVEPDPLGDTKEPDPPPSDLGTGTRNRATTYRLYP
jgi:hypothetical protein